MRTREDLDTRILRQMDPRPRQGAPSPPLPQLPARHRPTARPRTRAGCPRRRLTGARFLGASPPPTPCPRPSLFLRSAVCGGRRGPWARVGQGSARTRRPGTAAPARTRGPGNACSHTWAPTARAAVAGSYGRPDNCPPDSPAPAARPVQLRPAPGYEVDTRLSVTTSLQYVHTARTPVLPAAEGLQRASHTPRGPAVTGSSPLSLPLRELGPRLLKSRQIPGSLGLTLSLFLLRVFPPLSDLLHNYVRPLRLSSPRCLPQPPSSYSCSLRGGWGGSGMGRSPPPHLSPAAPDQQDSLSATPPARPGTGARWALGVGRHCCGPAAVASRPGGPWG